MSPRGYSVARWRMAARELGLAFHTAEALEHPHLMGRLDGLEVIAWHVEGASLEVRIEAVRALGRVGSVRAVPVLLELAEARVPREVQEAARDVARGIQSRLAGAEAGQVSVAQAMPEVGAVRVADGGDAGALSVPPARERE